MFHLDRADVRLQIRLTLLRLVSFLLLGCVLVGLPM